jgi:hypothetical protein
VVPVYVRHPELSRLPEIRRVAERLLYKDGNIALGYSITNSDADDPVFPGIRYTGHRFDDPLDLMPQGEKVILDGTNAQTQGLGARWGDYSALSVDPVDDCTLWYTTHVAGVGGTGPRPTRIASFNFETCQK